MYRILTNESDWVVIHSHSTWARLRTLPFVGGACSERKMEENDWSDLEDLMLLWALYIKYKRFRRRPKRFWVRPITLSWLKTVTFLETSFHAFPFAMVSLYPLHAMSQIHGNSRTASMTLSSMVAIFVTRCGSHVLSWLWLVNRYGCYAGIDSRSISSVMNVSSGGSAYFCVVAFTNVRYYRTLRAESL